MYIANFIPFEYAKNIIVPPDYESNSTFALRSLRSCQILEEIQGNTTLGDAKEGYLIGNPVMVSCWTMIENDYVTEKDWMELYEKGGKDKFARTDGIVIVSTVAKIEIFFKGVPPIGEPIAFRHGKVRNPIPRSERPESYDFLDSVFEKRPRYDYQREYRFAFYLPHRYPLEKITFYANPKDYIDKIQFGPEMKCPNRKELLFRTSGIFCNLIYPSFDDEWRKIKDSEAY